MHKLKVFDAFDTWSPTRNATEEQHLLGLNDLNLCLQIGHAASTSSLNGQRFFGVICLTIFVTKTSSRFTPYSDSTAVRITGSTHKWPARFVLFRPRVLPNKHNLRVKRAFAWYTMLRAHPETASPTRVNLAAYFCQFRKVVAL